MTTTPQPSAPAQPGTVYIYALKCPDTLQVRYVGKANDPHKRYKNHLTPRQLQPTTHKNSWLRKLLKDGKKPVLEILSATNEADWQDLERHYIKHYRSHGNLTNATDGGEGLIGYVCSLETRAKLSASLRGKNHRPRGKQPPEVVANRVAKITGRKRTPEQRAKLSAIQKAKAAECEYEYKGGCAKPKRVHRFALDGTHLDSFLSLTEMCKQLGWSFSSAEQVINGRAWKKTHQGFQLRYAEFGEDGEERLPCCPPFIRAEKTRKKPSPTRQGVIPHKGKTVERLTLSGELIDSFPGVLEMCRELGLCCGSVYRAIYGQRKSTKGFRFRYAE